MLKPLGMNNHRIHPKKTSKIICKCLQCTLQLTWGVRSTWSGKNISAREKDWDERLELLES